MRITQPKQKGKPKQYHGCDRPYKQEDRQSSGPWIITALDSSGTRRIRFAGNVAKTKGTNYENACYWFRWFKRNEPESDPRLALLKDYAEIQGEPEAGRYPLWIEEEPEIQEPEEDLEDLPDLEEVEIDQKEGHYRLFLGQRLLGEYWKTNNGQFRALREGARNSYPFKSEKKAHRHLMGHRKEIPAIEPVGGVDRAC